MEASPPSCLLLHHHHHHHHHSSERPADAYALVTESTNPPPSISILDPLTGNRIFVPSFTANAGFLLPSSSATSINATTITNTNANSNTSPSSGIVTVSPDSSTTFGAERGVEMMIKPTSLNEGPSGMEEPTLFLPTKPKKGLQNSAKCFLYGKKTQSKGRDFVGEIVEHSCKSVRIVLSCSVEAAGHDLDQ
eukprot:TsM_001189500 transcript=TsM_001189500 gene=TsM_001189500